MSGNGRDNKESQTVDPVRELDEVIRLIHFLGKSKPGGFTAALGWAEEKLRDVRETVADHGTVCAGFPGDASLRQGHAESFPQMSNLAVFSSGGTHS